MTQATGSLSCRAHEGATYHLMMRAMTQATYNLRPASLWLAASLLFFSGSSCGGGGSDSSTGSTARLSGGLSVFLPDITIPEAEPNDNLGSAQALGDLTVGATFSVVGNVSTSTDPNDVFEVRVPARLGVNVSVTGIEGGSSVQVLVLDPASLEPVQVYGPGSDGLEGSFVADGNVLLSVSAFSGSTGYTLRIEGASVGAGITETEPNNTAPEGNYLGTLQPAKTLSFSGAGADSGSGGGSDFFLFGASQGMTLSFTLESVSASDDYDVYIYDATSSLTSLPMPTEFVDSGSTESGSVGFTGLTLFAFEVRPFGGASGAYDVDVTTSLSLQAPPGTSRSIGSITTFEAGPRASVADAMALTSGVDVLGPITTATGELMDGDVIVQWALDPVARLALDPAPGVQRLSAMPGGGPELLRFEMPPGLDQAERDRYTLALAASLRGRAGVVSAEPDHRMRAFGLPQERRPNDTYYGLQWHYEQIKLPAAWDIETGSSNVRIAVLDTGSVPAMDLAPREIAGFDMINDAAIAGDGGGYDNDPTDVGDGLGSPQPSSFHGAHVAGTIGAVTDNSYGVSGVTWAGEIMHVRVLGIGGGSSFDIAQGVLYAAGLQNASGETALQPAHIINMSLGGGGSNSTFQNAITSARNSGVVIIAAAGNENSSTPSFPAAYSGVVSVSAVDVDGRRAPYSNFHASVDIAAPGGDVSADRNGDGYADGVLSSKPDDSSNPTNFESYSFYQGTSMAAPHVAGVAALILSVDDQLTPAQVEAILGDTATDLGAAGRDNIFGEGLLNALAAVQAADGGVLTAPDLALGSSSIVLTPEMASRVVGVANIGGGSLQITNAIATTNTGGNWLTATPISTGQAGGAIDTSGIEVTATPGTLGAGNYTGLVQVQSNGGTETVAVTLSISAGGGTAPDFEIFVIAVEFETFNSLAQDELRTSGSLSYTLGGLPPGEYLVVAGTDADNDGFICDEGEPLCGVYPSLELSETISVGTDQTVMGLDFPLQQAIVAAQTGGPRGFRLLNHPAGGGDAPIPSPAKAAQLLEVR